MNKKLADLFKSKVLANSAWLIVLQVFNTIVPLLTLPYITRVLGTSNSVSYTHLTLPTKA